ncbi:THAP domain-containing protein 6 [Stylophora pistillata]|uniref:THAP domain-containing protein 6 n=1 Tax=Stylophora pistillata TaxID=50429 RepID=A0A2B4R0D6_STYPI|nr:THAP domain-containing protein 6 [Stylophora pistillata]
MPTHCCVPGCTKKGYLEERKKISYFIFPTDKSLRNSAVMQSGEMKGKNFQISKSTKVCSRHFKTEDFQRSLGRSKINLKPGVVPSVFSWRTSPRKRKPPPFRHLVATGFDDISEAVSENEDNLESIEQPPYQEISTQTDETSVFENTTQTEDKVFEDKESQTEHNDLIGIMEKEIAGLKAEIDKLMKQTDALKAKLFNVDRFRSNSSSISFYTGFPDFEVFKTVFDFLDPGEYGQNIRYWTSLNTKEPLLDIYDNEHYSKSEKGRPRALKAIDEFFLVMCRLRQGFAEEHLSNLFHISLSTVSRVVISWVNFMYLKFAQINIWPSRTVIDNTMPEAFKAKYSATRVIIDCTEVRCQMPSSLQLNGELFSNYKNHTTLKGLIGISPGGAMIFVSELYTGSISDREIVVRSGFLDLPFDDKDLVMADKGFTIDDLMLPQEMRPWAVHAFTRSILTSSKHEID